MKVAIPNEQSPNETRVAAVPDSVVKMKGKQLDVVIESNAGQGAFISDIAYLDAGAKVVSTSQELYEDSDLILRVGPPQESEIEMMPKGSILLGLLQPAHNGQIIAKLASVGVSAFSLELLPRISRTQSMDALSSQAALAGYQSVITGASRLPKIMPMLMTAAGTLVPARVFVLGAGVAGLGAIATARRLGAIVEAFDVRRAAREEVESLGAKFVELPLEAAEGAGGYASAQSEEYLAKQRELLTTKIANADLVITTAAIPLGRAPILLTKSMIDEMRAGSVIVDLAAQSGGNTELTKEGEDVTYRGITIIGESNLATKVPSHASQTYSRNLFNVLSLLISGDSVSVNLEDEILSAMCLCHDGQLLWKPKA
ncbi:Re/Si-specific NAD(P)(+) transhydrogenase subunit alpha [Acidithrix ferrooxidans]|uniref:proton-translocating NAD(P)(+) transhydrogenase n=1 Tax=Acidithrix ferrooxidans TaxID=1280514 RepID=A0A0D8HG65_9ACTN|nr:Re/Si-specific NAD(P)(+) transhydrogenase subunit alpha [Acidithrix ferrooxidans]KJF16056.1 NAD(P) transhydrogenase subunit alpha part 1 [Acidithrix ferrooxidans]